MWDYFAVVGIIAHVLIGGGLLVWLLGMAWLKANFPGS